MVKRRVMLALTAGALLAGIGVTSALADGSPNGAAGTGTSAALSTVPLTDSVLGSNSAPQDQQGTDEQGTATDVTGAADDVLQEAGNPGADDESGDEQDSGQLDDQSAADSQSDEGTGTDAAGVQQSDD